jgi:WD40 repeat protein
VTTRIGYDPSAGAGTDATVAAAKPGTENTVAAPGAPGTEATLPTLDPALYVRGAEIARGGMGRIVEAHDRRLARVVAVKELLHAGGGAASRFEREALITAQLQHPAIVAIYEAGRWPSGEPFFAMKRVDGESLDRVVAKAKTLRDRLALIPSVLAVFDALAYAHSKHVIHRDLKPANVLVGAYGETVVIDWGLAKDVSAASNGDDGDRAGPYRRGDGDGETMAGAVMGTPSYMPPEQARGERVDKRADVYSLGALLYHVLAGTAPYTGTSVDVILAKVLADAPRPLREIPGMPSDLAAIVDKAMARAASERYPTAAELADDLRRFQTGQLVAAHAYSLPQLVARWVRRHRAVLAVASAAALALALGLVFYVRGVQDARDRADEQRQQADDQRARADAERLVAQSNLARALVEQGRGELLAGRWAPASVYLEQAYALGESGVAVRALLGDAMRSVEANGATLVLGGFVGAVAFDPSASRVLTTNIDLKTKTHATKIWSRAGDAIATLAGHDVGLARFTPDGTRVIGADGKLLQVWDANTGQVMVSMEHPRGVWSVALTVDGTSIVTTCGDTRARVWGLDGKPIATLEHRQAVTSAAFDGRGARVVTGGASTVTVWDLGGKAIVSTFEQPELNVLILSPDGTRVVTGSGQNDTTGVASSAHVWDAARGTVLATLDVTADSVTRAAFSPDGALVAIGGWGDTVKIFDANGALHTKLAGATGGGNTGVMSLAFSPDGKRLLTAAQERVARVWDVDSGELVAVLGGHEDNITTASFSADGARIVTGGRDGVAHVWDATPTRYVATVGARTANMWAAAPSPDGSRVAIASSQHAGIWTAEGKHVVDTENGGFYVTFDASGARVLSGNVIWDAATGRTLATLISGGRAGAFSPDGRHVVTGGDDGLVHVSDAQTGELVRTVKHAKGVFGVAFSPDGKRVATACADGTARIFDAQTGELVRAFPPSSRYLYSVAYSPDGTRLVTAGTDQVGRIWDVATAKLLFTLPGARRAAFSADGTRVVALDDRSAKIWDAASATLLASIDDNTGLLGTAAFDRSGRWLVTANTDMGGATIWSVGLETRPASAITPLVMAHVPLRYVDGQVRPR